MFHPGLAVHVTAAAGGRAFAAAAPMIEVSRNGNRARQADRKQDHKQADTGRQRHDKPPEPRHRKPGKLYHKVFFEIKPLSGVLKCSLGDLIDNPAVSPQTNAHHFGIFRPECREHLTVFRIMVRGKHFFDKQRGLHLTFQ